METILSIPIALLYSCLTYKTSDLITDYRSKELDCEETFEFVNGSVEMTTEQKQKSILCEKQRSEAATIRFLFYIFSGVAAIIISLVIDSPLLTLGFGLGGLLTILIGTIICDRTVNKYITWFATLAGLIGLVFILKNNFPVDYKF